MVAVNVATQRSEFAYDGLQRRVAEVQRVSGVVQSDARIVWCHREICEERASDGITVSRRAAERGEQLSGAARFLFPDHLGSGRDVSDAVGSRVASYEFDSWGRETVTQGSDATRFGYTGHRSLDGTQVLLALYRGYDPDLGRWLSEDPVGLDGGVNYYSYVHNAPVARTDPLGLDDRPWPINGRVTNTSGCRCTITALDMDRNAIHCVKPGESTSRSSDVDFVRVQGTWYKIGIWNFDVGSDCGPDGGFPPATAGELADIGAKLSGRSPCS